MKMRLRAQKQTEVRIDEQHHDGGDDNDSQRKQQRCQHPAVFLGEEI